MIQTYMRIHVGTQNVIVLSAIAIRATVTKINHANVQIKRNSYGNVKGLGTC